MKQRVLIVDDEPRWLEFARRELGTQYDVEVASELPVAVDKICTGQYDLVIVSARRLDTLERIGHECPTQRVIVTTIRQTTQEASRAYRLGAARYFPKSFGQ